jgi:hypothetical protein
MEKTSSALAIGPRPFVPAAFTQFKRTFVLWQFIRFIILNLRMMRLANSSHTRR